MERYCLEADENCDWYLMPVSVREAFQQWLLTDAAMAGSPPPAGVKYVGAFADGLTFTDPQIEEGE